MCSASVKYVVLRWALNYSSSSQIFDQTPVSMWYCADRLIARWFESDSSTEINVICFIWLQLTYFIISDHASLAILEFFNGLHPSFRLLLCNFSLLAKRGSDLSIWTGLICPLFFFFLSFFLSFFAWNIDCGILISWNRSGDIQCKILYN